MYTNLLTKNFMLMSAAEIKSQINQYLDQVDDSFLQAIYAMLETYVTQQAEIPATADKIEGIPATDEEVMASIEKGEEQLANGEYYTIDELKSKTSQWFNTPS